MQRVVREVALVDAGPQVAFGPVDERVVLPHRAPLVPLHRLRGHPRRRLLAPDPRDPRVRPGERALERGDLRVPAALLRAGPAAGRVRDLDADAEALLERPPRLERLREQHTGVDCDDPRVRHQPDQLVDEHRLLLLEGAEQHEAGVVAVDGLRQDVRDARARRPQTAHSPSPRMTWNGAVRCQSMKWFIVSSENSIGIARSLTSSSNRLGPTRSANALNGSSSSRPASYIRSQRSTASGTRLAARRTLRRVP